MGKPAPDATLTPSRTGTSRQIGRSADWIEKA
jgi:hypothetical protein